MSDKLSLSSPPSTPISQLHCLPTEMISYILSFLEPEFLVIFTLAYPELVEQTTSSRKRKRTTELPMSTIYFRWTTLGLWYIQTAEEWKLDVITMAAIASAGNLELLKLVRAKGCPWDTWTCVAAAKNGHLQLLQWLRAQGCPWDRWTCTYAAESGHLVLLQWARENGCPWESDTCTQAAVMGELAVLQWAHAHGCPWNYQVCAYAATLEILKWARENGAPWDKAWCMRTHASRHAADMKAWIESQPE